VQLDIWDYENSVTVYWFGVKNCIFESMTDIFSGDRPLWKLVASHCSAPRWRFENPLHRRVPRWLLLWLSPSYFTHSHHVATPKADAEVERRTGGRTDGQTNRRTDGRCHRGWSCSRWHVLSIWPARAHQACLPATRHTLRV